MFREIGGLLEGAIADHREGETTPEAFARFFAPRLRFFLGQLERPSLRSRTSTIFRFSPRPKSGWSAASTSSTATTT